jgi:hypothetical protein
MRRTMSIIVAVFALMVSACTQDRPVRPASPEADTHDDSLADDVLLLNTERGPVAVRPATGSVLFEDPDAVAAPDGSRLYSASSEGRSTVLETMHGVTGETLASVRVGGQLDVRVASGSGRAVALMAPLPPGLDPWTPVPRARTTIVVADPTGTRRPSRFVLDGNYEPEAFSTDDSRLFLIQYLPAEAPRVYRVTVLRLEDGHVSSVRGRFKTPPQRMPGIRLEQVFAPDGEQLYTLYSSEARAYAEGWGAGYDAHEPVTFVHVLNLERGWAYCAGVPDVFWGQPAEAQAMAVSPDGSRLYIVDSMKGVISVMSTTSLKILRTADVDPGFVGGAGTSAHVAADGSTLFVGSAGVEAALDAIEASTLDLLHRWPMPGAVSGLALSPDGLRLHVAFADGVSVLDPVTGEQLVSMPFVGADSILHVGTLLVDPTSG